MTNVVELFGILCSKGRHLDLRGYGHSKGFNEQGHEIFELKCYAGRCEGGFRPGDTVSKDGKMGLVMDKSYLYNEITVSWS